MGVGHVPGGPVGGAPQLEDETKVCQTLRRGALTSTKLFTLTEGAVCTNNWAFISVFFSTDVSCSTNTCFNTVMPMLLSSGTVASK